MKNKLYILFLIALANFKYYYSQTYWNVSATNNGQIGNKFGTINNFPINIYTNNIQRAQFTTGVALGPSPGVGQVGDGLKIYPGNGSNTVASLDLYTSGNNTTHVRFDGSGSINGQRNRLEYWANLNGFWFNTTTPNGRYIFNNLSSI